MKTFLEFIEAIIVKNADDIESFMDESDLMMFFKFKNEIYGGTEDCRVVFARMKNPTEDNPAIWRKEASFSAINLSNKVTKIFQHKDLKSIKVISREEAVKEMKNKPSVPERFQGVEITSDDEQLPANMGNIKEK